jgi:hypothetical protein
LRLVQAGEIVVHPEMIVEDLEKIVVDGEVEEVMIALLGIGMIVL